MLMTWQRLCRDTTRSSRVLVSGRQQMQLFFRTLQQRSYEPWARTGMRRCVVVSQGLLFPSRNPMIGLLRMMLARHVADSTAMERVLQESSIDWTIARPPYLKDG